MKVKCEECQGKGYVVHPRSSSIGYNFKFKSCVYCGGVGLVEWIDNIFPKRIYLGVGYKTEREAINDIKRTNKYEELKKSRRVDRAANGAGLENR